MGQAQRAGTLPWRSNTQVRTNRQVRWIRGGRKLSPSWEEKRQSPRGRVHTRVGRSLIRLDHGVQAAAQEGDERWGHRTQCPDQDVLKAKAMGGPRMIWSKGLEGARGNRLKAVWVIWMRNDRGLAESHGNRHGIKGHKTATKTSYKHNSISVGKADWEFAQLTDSLVRLYCWSVDYTFFEKQQASTWRGARLCLIILKVSWTSVHCLNSIHTLAASLLTRWPRLSLVVTSSLSVLAWKRCEMVPISVGLLGNLSKTIRTWPMRAQIFPSSALNVPSPTDSWLPGHPTRLDKWQQQISHQAEPNNQVNKLSQNWPQRQRGFTWDFWLWGNFL